MWQAHALGLAFGSLACRLHLDCCTASTACADHRLGDAENEISLDARNICAIPAPIQTPFRENVKLGCVVSEIRLPIRWLRVLLRRTREVCRAIVEKEEARGKFHWPR
jgi:hypothetical protein